MIIMCTWSLKCKFSGGREISGGAHRFTCTCNVDIICTCHVFSRFSRFSGSLQTARLGSQHI